MDSGNAIHPLFAVALFATGSERADKGNASDDNEYFFHCFLNLRLEIIVKSEAKVLSFRMYLSPHTGNVNPHNKNVKGWLQKKLEKQALIY